MLEGSSCALDPADSRCDDRAEPSAKDRCQLTTNQTYRSLVYRPGAIRKRQIELGGLSPRTIDHCERTRCKYDPSRSDQVSPADAPAPWSSPGDEFAGEGVCRPRRQAAGLVKNALYLLSGFVATGWFATFVHETQVSGPLRDANPHAPEPDHERLTGIWLHPVLYALLQDENNIKSNIADNADSLRHFLDERGLSVSGSTPIMRIETASTFDDPLLQAQFGLKYSYTARDPDQIVNMLSSLCNANDKSSFVFNSREVPIHRLDIANLPEPMDAGATLDLIYRKQEICVPGPGWR
jgi:hypothetical protein